MKFEVGDIVRLAWHDSTNAPGVVTERVDCDVSIWWVGIECDPDILFIGRIHCDDRDLILYDKAL